MAYTKFSAGLLLTCLSLATTSLQAAKVAEARLYCLSIRLGPGTNQFQDAVLKVTSTGAMDAGEGELIALNGGGELQLPGGESYASGISLYDLLYNEYLGGRIDTAINVNDDNTNRFPDFFEVSQGVNFVKPYGSMIIGTDYSSISVGWSRVPGTNTGNCTISEPFWGTFRHKFEILEYKGTLTYTPGSNSVSGTLDLVQTGVPTNILRAPLQFAKSGTDKFNQLMLQPGVTTGALLSTVNSFTNHLFTRDSAWPTNYAGYFEFSDGNPETYEPWSFWVLSITDTNDTDGNGIPDFGDDPASLARAAQLSLKLSSGQLQLSISGDVGRQYEIQGSPSLSSPNWQMTQTVTLASDPQVVPLALPPTTTFWRVVSR